MEKPKLNILKNIEDNIEKFKNGMNNEKNLSNYFDAKSARKSSNDNELNIVLKTIKEASEIGKRKIIIDKIKNQTTIDKLEELGYDVYEHWENLDGSITQEQFMSKLTTYSLTSGCKKRSEKPNYITQTAIEW